MVEYREVTTDPDDIWLHWIIEFDRALDPAWVCDQPAMRTEGVDAGPSFEALRIYFRRARSTVVVALDEEDLVGYIVADDDSSGRGGCRGRFMGVTDREVMQGLFDFLADKYGWVWGQITNPIIQAELLEFGCKPIEGGTFHYSYRRP